MSAYSYPAKPYRSAIKIAAVFLAVTLTAVVIAVSANMAATGQNRKSKYGLGSLPKTAQAAGGTRTPNELPGVVMVAPEDGSLTISEQPTFYWYVASIPEDRKANPTFEQGFHLRQDPFGASLTSSKTIFVLNATSTKTGLYRFTLPPSTPALEPGIERGWQIQVPPKLVGLSNIAIRLERKPAAIAELSKAKTNLEKARIFERFGYWYDAFDAYTRWLEANPKDSVARRERANMIEVGLRDNCDFRMPKVNQDASTESIKCNFLEDGKTNVGLLNELQSKIDASVVIDFESAPLEPKPKP